MRARLVSSNVYIPAQIADPSLIMSGDIVTVKAHWNQRNSNWRAFGDCVRDGKAIPPREMNSAIGIALGLLFYSLSLSLSLSNSFSLFLSLSLSFSLSLSLSVSLSLSRALSLSLSLSLSL
jgi:hypothetical protein